MVAIGVDTHKQTHTAVAIDQFGRVLDTTEIQVELAGYKALLAWALAFDGRLVFGIEGTGTYGAGLCSYLLAKGQKVMEVERPSRRDRRCGKSDYVDATSAATKVLAGKGLSVPRSRGDRELLKTLNTVRDGFVNDRKRALGRLHAIHLAGPIELRERVGKGSSRQVQARLLTMRKSKQMSKAELASFELMRDLACYCRDLGKKIDAYQDKIKALVSQMNYQLMDEPGVGPISAARLLVSSPERFKNEQAFARANGTAPLPASSGKTIRYRLNRGGDRQLNSAIHMVAVTRSRSHPESIAYLERKRSEGKTNREAMRSLKRHLSRRLFRQLTAPALTT